MATLRMVPCPIFLQILNALYKGFQMRYHLFQKFCEKVVKIKETSFLLSKCCISIAHHCRCILPVKECDFHPDVFVLFPCNIVVKIRWFYSKKSPKIYFSLFFSTYKLISNINNWQIFNFNLMKMHEHAMIDSFSGSIKLLSRVVFGQ